MEIEKSKSKKYWSLLETLCFSGLVFIIFSFSQLAGFILTTVNRIKEKNPDGFNLKFKKGKIYVNNEMEEIATMLDGNVLSEVILFSGIICIGLILLIIKFRKGASIMEYLNIKSPGVKDLVIWTLIISCFIGLGEFLSHHYSELFYTDFMAHAYKTAGSLPLLYLSIGIIGPLFEEIFFRGFLFKGLERSKVGGIGAVIITSLIFTFIHFQYNLAILLLLLPIGLILGFARLQTGNLIVPIILHSANNILGIVITGFQIEN